MFEGWGFLLSEIWVLIALAALLGLFIGWLVWGMRKADASDSGEAARLRGELDACQARARDCAARVSRLESDLSVARAASARPVGAVAARRPAPAPVAEPEPAPPPPPETEPTPAPVTPAEAPADDAEVGTKPATLDAPRDGAADDLKRIRGIGPKLEILCNRLGFWHFDQIANWTDAEIAWVDVNLESFKGRVTRDNWVAQARALADEGA